MRRHAMAMSSGTNPRKPSGRRASMPSSRLYITVLVAAVAAFFVVPVAQAAAAPIFNQRIEGNGGGKVTSVGGIGAYPGFEEFGNAYEGEPGIECSYASPGPATGVCENEVPAIDGFNGLALRALPTAGSEFAGWVLINVGNESISEAGVDCESSPKCFLNVSPGPEREAIAVFCTTGTAQGWGEPCEEAGPITPTLLKVVRIGEGTVASSPAGIECGGTCEHNFEIGELVTLTASPAIGYAFTSWAGCTEHAGLTCKVTMSAAKTVKATFTATPSLTVEKAGSGSGKATATGLSCDASCSKATAAIKAGTSVTVKTASSKGSEPAVFEGGTGSATGCSGASCIFTISANSSVKVKFDLTPTKTLTVKLTGPAAYKGKVSGKGIDQRPAHLGDRLRCGLHHPDRDVLRDRHGHADRGSWNRLHVRWLERKCLRKLWHLSLPGGDQLQQNGRSRIQIIEETQTESKRK